MPQTVAASDQRVDFFRRLTDVDFRRLHEPQQGQFIAEGEKILRRCVAAGLVVDKVLTEPKWLPTLAELPIADNKIFVADPAEVASITGYHVHRGVLAAVHRPVQPTATELLAQSRLTVVLADLVDHTNVGAAFRSATSLGAEAVLLSPACADPLYRRSIKVSMGSVLQIPWSRLSTWPQGDELADTHTVGLSLSDGAVDLAEVQVPDGSVALVVGTEGNGLSPAQQESCDQLATIPMSHGADSLNVAAALAVALYQARQWRQSS